MANGRRAARTRGDQRGSAIVLLDVLRPEKVDNRGALLTPAALCAGLLLGVAAIVGSHGVAQTTSEPPDRPVLPPPATTQQVPPSSNRRTRLILKDGSYQVVMGYRVDGANVRYRSAERGGAEEVIPLELVDLPATQRWEQRHLPRETDENGQPTGPPPIDPELLKEEADRAALTPEVAPDLRLPEQDSVLALDTFQGTPELVPIPQSAGELNHNTAHNILKGLVNPVSAPHRIVTLRNPRADVQVHVAEPEFYLRVGDDTSTPASGTAFTVDTHGSTANAPTASAGGSTSSRYVILRLDARSDSRLLSSFDLSGRRRDPDVIETTSTPIPGGHWIKLSSREPLQFGEYALVEVLDDRTVNLGVWDFGVHPVAPENRDVLKPEPKRSRPLDRRPHDQ